MTDWLSTLGVAMGSAWLSGINLYATAATLGLLQHFGLVHLPGELGVLGSWWVIGVAAGMYLVEFIADKIPAIDSIWDAVHTFIRIPAGAVMASAAFSHADPAVRIIALLVGGGVALSSHGTKAAVRATANLSPEPFSNIALSLAEDEGPRPDSSLEALAKLRPAFAENGSVTAGNSSPLNDGASALVLMSAAKAKERGLKPLARLVSAAPAGVHPDYMGIGPVPASSKALEQAGLHPSDMDLVELNEAFASQALACMRLLGLDEEKVNVNGGAIALGHPLGSSGARLVGTLVREMAHRDAEYGLAAMCIGVGQGIASVWQRV